jgi:hypothetical protein
MTGRPGANSRPAPAETAVAVRAAELGWELVSGWPSPQQVFRRWALPTTILAELVTLIEAATEMKWGLAQLGLEGRPEASGEIVVRAVFERRLEARMGIAIREGLARRQAAGVRLGRRPLIPDAILARIARDRAAGKGYSQIARELQAAGVPTAQGGRDWHASTVRAAHLRATQAPGD